MIKFGGAKFEIRGAKHTQSPLKLPLCLPDIISLLAVRTVYAHYHFTSYYILYLYIVYRFAAYAL